MRIRIIHNWLSTCLIMSMVSWISSALWARETKAASSLFLTGRPPWPCLTFLKDSLYFFLYSALSCFLATLALPSQSLPLLRTQRIERNIILKVSSYQPTICEVAEGFLCVQSMTAQGINNSQPAELGAGMPPQKLQHFLTAWITSIIANWLSKFPVGGKLGGHLISLLN